MVAVANGYRLNFEDQYSDIKFRRAHDVRYTQEVVNRECSVRKARQKAIPFQSSCR